MSQYYMNRPEAREPLVTLIDDQGGDSVPGELNNTSSLINFGDYSGVIGPNAGGG